MQHTSSYINHPTYGHFQLQNPPVPSPLRPPSSHPPRCQLPTRSRCHPGSTAPVGSVEE